MPEQISPRSSRLVDLSRSENAHQHASQPRISSCPCTLLAQRFTSCRVIQCRLLVLSISVLFPQYAVSLSADPVGTGDCYVKTTVQAYRSWMVGVLTVHTEFGRETLCDSISSSQLPRIAAGSVRDGVSYSIGRLARTETQTQLRIFHV